MSFYSGDTLIKTAIELGLADIKKQPWLIQDMLSDFVNNPYLREKYGQKEIARCKEWFENNNIEVLLKYRNDKDTMPCVTIALGGSSEKQAYKTLGDLSPCVETLMPGEIGKPIPYVLKPFVPQSYDEDTGEIVLPDDLGTDLVEPGMVVVDPATGNGYVVVSKSATSVFIAADTRIRASKLGVVPQYQFYRARREHAWFDESYSIGCHVHGDPAALLWLHAIVAKILLRYREGLLESNGFAESRISSSDMVPNQHMDSAGGEHVFSRYITLTGVAEYSWLKTPYRVIESLVVNEDVYEGSGIKIISNKESSEDFRHNQPWTTVDGEDYGD